ncbi:MAG TPA: glycosyltransferase family A protein, partial [Pirellulales bacterium]
MPSLSCVIPAVGSIADLETTLVSVLEKRPADCKIIVVLNQLYDDHYGLKDEVRFVELISGGMAACATLGIQVSEGQIVHVLAAGIEVTDGWVDAALPHFADPEVVAVAPVIRSTVRPERVLAAGVKY